MRIKVVSIHDIEWWKRTIYEWSTARVIKLWFEGNKELKYVMILYEACDSIVGDFRTLANQSVLRYLKQIRRGIVRYFDRKFSKYANLWNKQNFEEIFFSYIS